MQYWRPVFLLLDLFPSLYTVSTSFQIAIFKASISETSSELNQTFKDQAYTENP